MINQTFSRKTISAERFRGHDISISVSKIRKLFHPSECDEIIRALASLPDVLLDDEYLIIPSKYLENINTK